MPGDLLDLILIALAAAFAVAGWRQGFIIGVLSFAGFLGGAALGAMISPHVALALASGATQQALVAIVVVFAAAMAGQLLASVIGAWARQRVTWRRAAFVDAAGGAAVSVISVLLIAWLIGSAVARAPFPGIATQANNSAVLQGVDRFMPQSASTMFSDFRRLVANGPYAEVFGSLGAGSAASVPPPDPGVVRSPGFLRAAGSVVKVRGEAPECGQRIEGSGFVYAPEHVLTNAHVVAGVVEGADGTPGGPDVFTRGNSRFRSTVVLYDPEADIAVLYVPGLHARALKFQFTARSGGDAIVAGYPQNLGFSAGAARIADKQLASGRDIYHNRTVTRQIYKVRANVQSGNSGGPLLSPSGHVYGVVFAAAVNLEHTGYALTAREVAPDASRGENSTAKVSTQSCDSSRSG